MQVDGQGDTVLHTLWRDGEPCVVDPEFYTPEMLALKGCGGMTVLDYAARIGMLHFIPKKCQEAGCALRYEQEREEAAAEMEYREEGEATAAEIED